MSSLLLQKRMAADDEASELCHDMLVEVLTRLPLRSFSRSRCVSKSWRDLASGDHVRSKLPLVVSGVSRLRDDDTPTYVSTLAGGSSIRPVDLGFLPFRSGSTLVDCCDGLLLFYSSPLAPSFHVCNAITGRSAALPRPTSGRTPLLSVALFDPTRSRHFRVVSFVRWLARGAELEVFDSELGGWAAREARWGLSTDALTATMRYADGVLYVLAQPRQMVAVRLDSMACDVVELPEAVEVGSCVGKLGGRLHYSVGDGRRLRAWALEGEEWVLKHCVEIKMDGFRVMGFNPEREVVYMRVGTKLVAYDLCEEGVEEVWEFGQEGKGHLMHVWVFPFAKNLEDLLS
ncbi:uncharacterized protein M6B38_416915 [Iris pallida]|uniref:F-box domain-containing protein n=1 Tax=Iris pallida TaxID=29817 RepID=A0AAX6FJD5_IRIPA|nr:uncharacterized protein M6B38_416915 [Iris pallida]